MRFFFFLLLLLVPRKTDALRPPMTAAPKQYLVWSKGVAPKSALAYVGISLVARRLPETTFLVVAETLQWSAALGLMSSSCCVLQLALNLLSIGCAGVNSVLGPLRPLFLALTAYIYAHRPLTPLALLAAALTFSPEMLTLLERYRRASFSYEGNERTVRLPTMGCAACVDAVSRAVRNVDGVANAKVDLLASGGQVTVVPVTDKDPQLILSNVIDACHRAGFPGGTLEAASSSNDL